MLSPKPCLTKHRVNTGRTVHCFPPIDCLVLLLVELFFVFNLPIGQYSPTGRTILWFSPINRIVVLLVEPSFDLHCTSKRPTNRKSLFLNSACSGLDFTPGPLNLSFKSFMVLKHVQFHVCTPIHLQSHNFTIKYKTQLK